MVSTSWTNAPYLCSAIRRSLGDERTVVEPRQSDWGLRGTRLRLHRLGGSIRLLWRARRAKTLVVLHAGSDVFAVAGAMRALHRQTRLVVVDFLIPGTTRLSSVQNWALQRVDAWVCIRSGDIETLGRRFKIDRERCRFAYFPPTFDPEQVPAAAPPITTDRYVFASGSAHRDWSTLFDALEHVDCDAIISAELDRLPPGAATRSPRIQVTDHVSPADGQSLAARALVVVVPMRETELPAGPSVLVDAMALGRAVVATETRGTTDYVRDGITGWLVPAGDATALAEAINHALNEPVLRERIATAARRAAVEQFSPAQFAAAITELCRP